MKAVDISYKSILSHFEASLYKTTHFQVIYSKTPSRVQYSFHSLIYNLFHSSWLTSAPLNVEDQKSS